MRIRFDPDFDGGAWPGPLGSVAGGDAREAVAGEAWLGELGLLGHLETVLGLARPAPSEAERAAALAPRLRETEGFWSASAEVDPLGAARELLRWREALVRAGWRGEPEQGGTRLPDRVVALSGVTRDLPPSAAERAWEVADALEHRSGEIDAVELLEPAVAFDPVWQCILSRLSGFGGPGYETVLLPHRPAPARGDLAAARAKGFAPALDGSLQLLRPDGPWEAAEEAAAWLAAQLDADAAAAAADTVVIGPTPLLDGQLQRFGLPATGARERRGGGALLEVLPLVLSAGWLPADPAEVVELLTLLESPVPKRVGNRLLRALEAWPAVGSPVWDEHLRAGLERIEDARRRERVAARVEALFRPSAERRGERYPVAEVRRRVGLVQQWLRARRERVAAEAGADAGTDRGDEGLRPWDEALAHASAFEALVALARPDAFGEAELHRFLEEARGVLADEPVHGAQAGLASVASPAAVAGPARVVLWWGFDRASAPRPPRLPFTREEAVALARAGILLPDAGEEAERHAQRWHRPLDHAAEALVCVAPRADEAGEESHPHPLWDEIRARAADADAAARLAVARLRPLANGAAIAARREPVAMRPRPAPQRAWRTAPGRLAVPERVSRSNVESLLACPLQWTLAREARLAGSARPGVDAGARVLGILAHALLEQVLPAAGSDPAAARERAGAWFDAEAPRRVATLFLPGREAACARVRRLLCDAAGFFCRFLAAGGLRVARAETTLEAPGLGRTLHGIPDLVLEADGAGGAGGASGAGDAAGASGGAAPAAVVDAKWGGLRRKRDALEGGTAAQLAFYAHLWRRQPEAAGVWPAVAYFVLSERRLLTSDARLAGPAEHVAGPDPAETWLALERAFDARAAELAGGQLVAPACPDGDGAAEPAKDGLDGDGRLVLAPACIFCDFGGLCGAAFVEGGA